MNTTSKALDTQTSTSRYLADVKLPDASFRFPQQDLSSHAISNLDEALQSSLEAPINYPPIKESLFAGDQIAIALHADLPRPADIVQALIGQLTGMDFVIVCSGSTASQLESMGEVNGKLTVHDPEDENSLAMIGIDDQAAPVYVNRMLSDADVVIPVGVANGPNEKIQDCVYPFFSGLADRESFEARSPKAKAGQVRLANNQLGTFWGIQLVFGPGDEIHEIVAGEMAEAIHQANQKMAEVWQVNTNTDADFVIATLEAEKSNQSWDQFAAAIISADQVAQPGAPIAICSELSQNPPRKIKSALVQQFETRTSTKLSDSLRKVAAIVAERTVFLQSDLSPSQTEELGLGCISSPQELQRIIDRHTKGMLLRDAHRCNLTIV